MVNFIVVRQLSGLYTRLLYRVFLLLANYPVHAPGIYIGFYDVDRIVFWTFYLQEIRNRTQSRKNQTLLTSATPCAVLATLVRFELTNARVKVSCLATRRYPNIKLELHQPCRNFTVICNEPNCTHGFCKPFTFHLYSLTFRLNITFDN